MNERFTSVGLSNPKSPANVGSVMRAAGCFAVDSVFYTGVRYNTAKKFHTDTKSVTDRIPLESVDSLYDAIPANTRVVCVELAEGAQTLVEFVHPDRACYLFGPEDGTLDQDIVDRADAVVFIPTYGCLNLAASVNIILYDRFAKKQSQRLHAYGDELIVKSRDRNNRLKVK